MAAAGDVWLSSAAVFMWQRNAAGYDTKTFREDRHGGKRKIAAGAAVAAIQCSNVPRYIFLHDRDSCVMVKM